MPRRRINPHVTSVAALEESLPTETSPLQVLLNDMGFVIAAEMAHMRQDAVNGVRLTNEGAQKMKHMATSAVAAQDMHRKAREDANLGQQSAAELVRIILADPEAREQARRMLAAESEDE
jgi:hypothetical protein